MIRFEIRGVRFRMPLLTILAPLIAVRLGMHADIASLALALGIHEAAHLLAAAILKVEIQEICIMPFGGSAKMGNPYHLPAIKIIAAAAAGPLSNLLMVLLFSSAAQWKLIPPNIAMRSIEPNIILFLFNLVPALPLDGGRILVALLSVFIDEKKALRAGICCGRFLSLLLIAVMIYGGIKKHVWNLSFLLAAVFIIASEKDECLALGISKARRIQEVSKGYDMQPARLYHIDGCHSAAQALSLIRPRENAWFVIMDDGIPLQLLDSRTLVSQLSRNASSETKLSDIPGIQLRATQTNAFMN